MAKEVNCYIVDNEFEFQPHYNVHFQINTHVKAMNPLILPAMG